MNEIGYESLASVLKRAYDQAAKGKGAERHANKLPFDRQPMQSISALLNDHTGLLYQAMKKIQESKRMDKDAAVRELLGAINCVAGAILFLEREGQIPDRRKVVERVVNPATGLATHWMCGHGAGINDPRAACKVPIGQACPVCLATA